MMSPLRTFTEYSGNGGKHNKKNPGEPDRTISTPANSSKARKSNNRSGLLQRSDYALAGTKKENEGISVSAYACQPSPLRSFTTTRQNLQTPPRKRQPRQKQPKMTTTATTLKGQPLDKIALDAMLRRRMFFTPSFEIYGGIAGLFDLGPPGAALQSNLIDTWKKHFIIEENMLEVDCTALTPHVVLKTSGHVDKFADWMCKDPKTGDILRADHFVEDVLEARLNGDKEARGLEAQKTEQDKDPKREKRKAKGQQAAVKLDDAVVKEYEEILAQIDNYDGDQLGELITKYDLRNPKSGLQPTPPVPFNLMFQTSIGPNSNVPSYLRPETAQGQFMNFAKLLEYNMGAMPFASASIGKSYRNEISPRGGLLRVREFLMAEIEHFVDPESGKKHSRFHEVENIELNLLDRHTQLAGQTTVKKTPVGSAVKDGVIDNETLGYFLARISLFLEKIGVDVSKLRFRQHMANEMAHYACDCWDAELLTSSGWVECVGCADRSAYDLAVHAKQTGKPLVVREALEEPRTVTEWEVEIDKKKFGPKFKKDAKAIEGVLLATTQEQREGLAKDLKEASSFTVEVPNLGKVEVGQGLVAIEQKTRTENVREYIPNVIEPSFGIGRILYALCEQNFWTRADDGGDEARGVLSFPPAMAPTKVLIVPLSSNKSFAPAVNKLSQKLRAAHISCRVDQSGASIGKRYSRNDEVGTALAVTIDFQTLEDNTITLRDRDTTRQVRADEDKVIAAIQSIVNGGQSWQDVEKDLPIFAGQEV
ncbi:Fc.00g005450.m01.CDS01 [Cosmosporella sp. VM-42]